MMNAIVTRRLAHSAVLALGLVGCTRAPAATAPAPVLAPPVVTNAEAIAEARADSMRRPYTQADVDFMTHMVGHHAQAILMSGFAPERAQDAAVKRLAARIINAQVDEITLMQQWLADRQKPVPMAHVTWPVPADDHAHHTMAGMLSPAQLTQLRNARGREFDRLFLEYMIQHHRGAMTMVKTLFGTQGAAQDETIFRFASDVNVDQETEVARMEKMLASFQTPSTPNQP